MSINNTIDKIEITICEIKTSFDILPNHIKIKKSNLDLIFFELYDSMCYLKSEIDKSECLKLWDNAKRKVNPYEFVNMLGTNILKTENIKKQYFISNKKYAPLSRAFFKLTEIWSLIDLIPIKYKNKSGYIANIAEGPGGFIEAIYKQRKVSGILDTYCATTLYAKNKNIPGWNQLLRRKAHFLNNKNVNLKTGNLYEKNTILNYSSFFKENKAFLVTCDGGFDYSDDFNNQEINSRRIIYAEIITTLLIQEKGGNMVCKMFDIFTYFSIQLLYILSIFYEKINIIKPVTSRPANSEKYIISLGFKGTYISKECIDSMLDVLDKWDTENEIIIEDLNVPDNFIEQIKDINLYYTNNQKKYITKTLNYITDSTKYNINEQIKYSDLWFDKYNVVKKEYT
jgi:23S rRNA U2552 (ribose-2'-O)-methylase RlmE/FtsJ